MTAKPYPADEGSARKKDWAPSRDAFDRLLAWLDEGGDTAGDRYLAIRRRLVAYFDRRHCSDPDALADHTLNRVARRLEEEGGITGAAPAQYCYIVARYVFLESRRDPGRQDQPFALHTPSERKEASLHESDRSRERHLDCLERCLSQLPAGDHDLILGYYSAGPGDRIVNRRSLAERLGLTPNALAIKASRLRARLESCVAGCVQELE